MSNNPYLVLISINISLQQLILVIANILPTIDALTFVNPVGDFFRVLELKFLVKSFEKILQFTTFFRQKDETFKMLYMKLLKFKEDTQNITDLEVAHRYLHSFEGTLSFHVQVL